MKLIALMGWQRLANYFRAAAPLPGSLVTLTQASIGGMSYRNALEAAVSAQGLALQTGFLFKVGHPPLLIPWSAIGPFRATSFLWTTIYSTTVQTPAGSVALRFVSPYLMEAARRWTDVEVME
ncbi:hypothetical protein KBK19_09365 [Microvirga sp. STR05]|uniref:Uncharacterized protein n=1 Tax=Hymenobacter duratus TaxID=2771356 RepID=A0ABR8JGN3_9BACT|nr:hypothetical protein [Hymenobacter duratus]MBD2715242.1 hypothetical protein [Hymenobacter duratus]MBR7950149.1 hypothetical protein [Microvirga sp. STR05]